LLAGVHDGEAQVWDVASTSRVVDTSWSPHRDTLLDVAFSPDERRVLTASADGTAQVWEVNTAIKLLSRFTAPLRHGGAVKRALFSKAGARILTASADGSVRLWDLAPLAPAVPPLDQPAGHTAAFNPDGSGVLTAGFDDTARIWEVQTGLPRTGRLWQGSRVTSAAFSPDGTHLITTGNDGSARLWNSGSGRLDTLLPPGASVATAAAFSPDGGLLATGSSDGSVRLWDAHTGAPRGAPATTGSPVKRLSFTADAKYLLIQGERTARLWQVQPLRPIGEAMQHGAEDETALVSARLSPDGTHVLTAGGDGTAQLWEAPAGTRAGTLLSHHSGLSLAVFDFRGKQVAAVGRDRTATVLDVKGTVLCGPLAHPSPSRLNGHLLTAAMFSPDDDFLLTAGSDGLARVWEAAGGELVAAPWAHRYPVFSAVFHPDSRKLVVCASELQGPGVAVVHTLVNESMPLADLRRLARLLSGQRVGADGREEQLPADEVDSAWQTLRGRYPRLFEVSAEQVLAWHRWELDGCARAFNAAGIEANLTVLLKAEPKRWTHHFGQGLFLGLYRGDLLASADAYAKAIALGCNDDRAWHLQAISRLLANDLPGYRRVCAEVVARFGSTRVPELAWQMAQLCLYLPDAVADFRPVLALAECSWKHTPQDHNSLTTLGGALLRLGRLDEAWQRLQEAAFRQSEGGSPYTGLLLALVEARRSNKERAQRHFDDARKAAKGLPAGVNRRLLGVLEREVEASLKGIRAGAN
jgi:WD40 repeat protein